MKSNFYPITFDFSEFDVQSLPYQDGLLQSLRQQYNATHSFFRNKEFIYVSPGVTGTPNLGRTVRLAIEQRPEVVSSLIKHLFFRAVKEAQPELKPEFYPFRFASRKTDFDLAHTHVPEPLRDVLTFKRITEVQFRHYTDSNNQLVFGALINHRYRWYLDRTCQDLLENGFDLIGREVTGTQQPEYSDGVVAPEITLLGPVRRVTGSIVTVDTSSGPLDYAASQLRLHTSRINIAAFLAWYIGEERADIILQAIKADEGRRLRPQVVMEEIEAMGRWLSRLTYRNFDSFGFTLTNDNTVTAPLSFALNEPSLIFDLSKTRVHTQPSLGLNQYGPYSRSVGFSLNTPRILVIFHRHNAGIYTKFLAELRDGVPDHKWFPNGMIGKYRLTSISFHIEEITDYSFEAYLSAINRAVSKAELPFDLAILESQDSFRRLAVNDNPYFRAKAELYMQGTAVQFVRPEIARDTTYTIDGIALQLYAKLGGTPWTIPVDQSVDKELVIGIGSAILRPSHYAGATQARFVGISTFFAADGKYLANSRTRNVGYEDYFDELLRSLKEMLDRLSGEYSWNPEDRIRLIFHIFKPIKNLEADVVARLVGEYPQYDIRFAFVTLSERHPYVLYDERQPGNYGKGANVPTRGYTLPLGPRQCLVQLMGTREVRTVRHGAPTPVLVSIHDRSTFSDMQYIVQQVFKFSRLSFRAFTPSYTPATLLYANLLTRQLKDLRGIPGWNSTNASLQLREKKWFL